ncbi:32295_t:CDS:2, partial [Gigaspora margarita]
MDKPPHRLSDFIIVLEEKANKSNKYCVCRECISGSSYAEAKKHKFANTQELVRHHLKDCIYFKQKYSESEQQEILEKPDKSISETSNPIQEETDDNSKATSSKNSMANVRKNMIDRYCFWPLNEDQQKHFKQLILKATVSCGWAFSHYLCFASIIKSCAALKNLATKIEEENDDTLKDFPRNIFLNISDNECYFTEVLHSFRWVCQIIKDILDEELKDYLLTKLEKRCLIKVLMTFPLCIWDDGLYIIINLGLHKKVLAMCQLRLELLYSRNIIAIDKSLKTYKQNIGIPPENNEQIILEDNEEELLDDNVDYVNDVGEQNKMNVEQLEIVSLAEEKEDDYMQCDSYSLNESEISTD